MNNSTQLNSTQSKVSRTDFVSLHSSDISSAATHNSEIQIKSGAELKPELKGAYDRYVTTERMGANSDELFKNEFRKKGFTLIELSIVIVIIGILVGGVVLGGKVIDRARLAKFATELSDINRAMILFQDTYNAWPGDYAGVTGVGDCTATGDATIGGSATWPYICPGDGDGKIESGGAHDKPYEYIYGRNHLIYEGFLNDSFSRRLNTTIPHYNKFPKSYQNMGWFLQYRATSTFLSKASNVLFIAYIPTSVGIEVGLLYQIDKKIDDGYPLTGVLGTDATACIVGTVYTTATTAGCWMLYKLE